MIVASVVGVVVMAWIAAISVWAVVTIKVFGRRLLGGSSAGSSPE
jgi:hypothetical protein